MRSSSPMKPRKSGRDDLFFEDLEMPRENYYDEAAEDRALSRRIRGIVALAVVVCVGIVVIWFNWMPGGQIFRARFGLGAPASAYKALGAPAVRSSAPPTPTTTHSGWIRTITTTRSSSDRRRR